MVTTNRSKGELDARWPANTNVFVRVSVPSYYETDGQRFYFPVLLESGRLGASEEAGADRCYEKYDKAKVSGLL